MKLQIAKSDRLIIHFCESITTLNQEFIMTYKRFEDLPVWQEALHMADQTYDLTEAPHFKCSYSLRDQLERAALSVSNNIAEGFERSTTKELLAFIYVARGSAGEVRSMLCFLERRKKFEPFKSQISNLKLSAEGCSRQLRGWAGSLQDSDIKGTRHMNQFVRQEKELRQSKALPKKHLASVPSAHPPRTRTSKSDI